MSAIARILVIEDDPYLRKACQTALRKRGFAVASAIDGEQGLAEALARPPDLILLDRLMPRQSGIDVLRAVKADERTRAVPVLVLSNSSRAADREEALALGAAGYIVKASLSLKELAHVERLLAAPRAGESS